MIKMNDTSRFWLAVALLIAGVVLVFFGFFTPPVGQVHGSVLGFFGEVSCMAGALLGIDIAIDNRINKRLNNDKKDS